MLPSQTVENYLKTIYLAQAAMASSDDLVPMGQIANALGVVPGTATTMVKTLAESGLVRYEPYMGVRLTPAGEKLASRVLRRHRLIELFLVKVLGMNWADVHDEAERLEHAVSEQLVDRIDRCWAVRSSIRTAIRFRRRRESCRMRSQSTWWICSARRSRTPLVVTRVLDQDAEFLRFVEDHHLMPGSRIVIESRDPGSDAVSLTSGDGSRTTLGTRAASQILVRPES